MLCLSKYTQLPEFFIEILHVSGYSRLDGSEVMIFELLALRCFCSEKCSSCINKIFSLIIELYRNEEVFLLRSYCSSNCEMRIGVTEESQDTDGLLADDLHRTEKRCLLVECLAAVRTESGRDAECVIFDESVACRIPCCISSCFECSSKSAGREGRCIRLTLNKFFSREFHDHAAV